MPLILGANSASAGGYNVENSLRFNTASSDYLNKTFSASNRKTFTISFWMKRSILSVNQGVISTYLDGANLSSIYLQSANSIQYYNYVASGFPCNVSSSALFRDVSAWYHVVLVYDSTQGTSTDRVKLYVNGSQMTLTGGFPSLNDDSWINSANPMTIGREGFYTGYLGAYLSEFYLIDGQALTPSSFGETDFDTGIWKPKAYTGTYGTNGFYLEFQNSGALGTDSSGNGNTFTVNNLTSIDQTTDTPTNNFATMNPLNVSPLATATFSNGNNEVTVDPNDVSIPSTIGVNKGKWYWEVKWTADGSFDRFGIMPDDAIQTVAPHVSGISWDRLSTTNGMYILNNIVSGSWGSAFTVGDIINFALDCDNTALYIGQNGTWRNSGVPTSGSSKTGAVDYSSTSLNGKYLFPAFGKGGAGTSTWQTNFGNPPFTIVSGNADAEGFGNFEYAVPSGYFALCTKNLADYG